MTLTQILAILRARARFIALVTAATLLLGAAITYLMPKQYRATVSLVLDYSEPLAAGASPAQAQSGYLATQVDIVRSMAVARRVVEIMDLSNSPAARDQFIEKTQGRGRIEDWLAEALLQDMTVMPARESRVIDISFDSLDPEFSAQTANAFAQAYIETTLKLAVEPARQSVAWFDSQLDDLRRRVEESQRRLTVYQKEQGIVATDERVDLETSRLNEFSYQLAMGQLEAQNANERILQMEEIIAKGGDPETLPAIMSNSFIQTLKGQILQQESRLTEFAQSMGRNHPEYKAAQSELTSLKTKLKTEMRTVMAGMRNDAKLAEQREHELRRMVEAQKEKVLNLREQRDTLPALLREVDSAQRSYDAALARVNENTLQSRVNQTNVAVLTPAVAPVDPSRPRPMLNMSVALFIGLFLGINLSIARELYDRRVRSEDDLALGVRAPLLAVVAHGDRPAHEQGIRGASETLGEQPMPTPRKALGQILLSERTLLLDDVVAILARQRASGERFGEAAVSLGLLSREDVMYTLARQYDYSCLRPGEGGYSNELVAAYQPFNPEVEAFRRLRAQLLLRWFEKGRKSLAVIGPDHDAGRSYLTANLGIVFAQLGQRTLIVDADLRGGRMHKLFKARNDRGMAGVLSGRAGGVAVGTMLSVDTVAVSVPHFPNLWVLPSGPVPPNPLELLTVPRFRDLLNELGKLYDVILIDTPACMTGADAETVAVRAGGALLVARRDVTRMKMLQQLEQRLERTKTVLVGSVLTEFTAAAQPARVSAPSPVLPKPAAEAEPPSKKERRSVDVWLTARVKGVAERVREAFKKRRENDKPKLLTYQPERPAAKVEIDRGAPKTVEADYDLFWDIDRESRPEPRKVS